MEIRNSLRIFSFILILSILGVSVFAASGFDIPMRKNQPANGDRSYTHVPYLAPNPDYFYGLSCSHTRQGIYDQLTLVSNDFSTVNCNTFFLQESLESCGNGIIETEMGEECDPEASGWDWDSCDNCIIGECSTPPQNLLCSCATVPDHTVGGNDQGIKYLVDGHENLEDCNSAPAPAGVQTNGCCGDQDNEWLIEMNDFQLFLPDGTPISKDHNYACCDDITDCVYRGQCYDIWEIIEEYPRGNPAGRNARYMCGDNNLLYEAVRYDYMDYVAPSSLIGRTVPVSNAPLRHYMTQEEALNLSGSSIARLSCNSVNPNLPQVWRTGRDCETGKLRIKVLDGRYNNVPVAEGTPVTVRFAFLKSGVADLDQNKFYEDTFYKQVEGVVDSNGEILVENLYGFSYSVSVIIMGGSLDVSAFVRVNYDSTEQISVSVLPGTGCMGCFDLQTSTCSADCDGKSIVEGNECSFSSDVLKSECDYKPAGARVVIDEGGVERVYECCPNYVGDGDEFLYNYVPKTKAVVDCDKDNLLTKRYVLTWGGKPISVVVTVCDE